MRMAPCAFVLLLATGAPARAHDVPAAEMTAAAQAFLASLSPELRARAVHPLTDAERENWAYVPRRRAGVFLRDLGPAAHERLQALLRTALSARGHALAGAIVALEPVLGALEGSSRRDPGLYAVTVFGAPAPDGSWGWRFEGHHLSLNFTIVEGRYAAGTPAFYGANPAGLRPGRRGSGPRVFPEEEDLARELLQSLDAEQRRAAVIAVRAPADIVTADSRRALLDKPAGLPAGAMTPAQSDRLLALLRTHVFRQHETSAGSELQKIMDAGWEQVHFAWAGPAEPGEPHYYRIHGPTFVVEYDNVQDGGDHVHSVWRDFEGDFGRDLLREHYAEAHGR